MCRVNVHNMAKRIFYRHNRKLQLGEAVFVGQRKRIFEHNKKSELMLMRRAGAYSSSCSQVILIYLHSFRRSLLFCSQNRQNLTKNRYF